MRSKTCHIIWRVLFVYQRIDSTIFALGQNGLPNLILAVFLEPSIETSKDIDG